MSDTALTEQGFLQKHAHSWRALRSRNYRLYFTGQGISSVGTWMTKVATSWLVYRLTHSAVLLGWVGFASTVPNLLLSPFAGVLADRMSRPVLILYAQVGMMVTSLALAALTFDHWINYPVIILLNFLNGTAGAFDIAARSSFTADLVEDRDDLSNAIALNSSAMNIARFAGPSIAGAILAVTNEGYCFLIDGLSYIAVIATMLMIRTTVKPRVKHHTSMLDQLRHGWRYVADSFPHRTILIFFTTMGMLGIPYSTLMPMFAGGVLHGGPRLLGLLLSAPGIGALAGGVALASRRSVVGLFENIGVTAMLFGASLLAFSLSRVTWISLVLLLVAGFGATCSSAACSTVLQTISPDNMRGRVMSYYLMGILGMFPFGVLLAGWLGKRIGAPHTVLFSGIGIMGISLWLLLRTRRVVALIHPVYKDLGLIKDESEAETVAAVEASRS